MGLAPRLGGIDVKGKGHMRTYWVCAGRAAAEEGAFVRFTGFTVCAFCLCG